jgi:hypothetical protein
MKAIHVMAAARALGFPERASITEALDECAALLRNPEREAVEAEAAAEGVPADVVAASRAYFVALRLAASMGPFDLDLAAGFRDAIETVWPRCATMTTGELVGEVERLVFRQGDGDGGDADDAVGAASGAIVVASYLVDRAGCLDQLLGSLTESLAVAVLDVQAALARLLGATPDGRPN